MVEDEGAASVGEGVTPSDGAASEASVPTARVDPVTSGARTGPGGAHWLARIVLGLALLAAALVLALPLTLLLAAGVAEQLEGLLGAVLAQTGGLEDEVFSTAWRGTGTAVAAAALLHVLARMFEWPKPRERGAPREHGAVSFARFALRHPLVVLALPLVVLTSLVPFELTDNPALPDVLSATGVVGLYHLGLAGLLIGCGTLVFLLARLLYRAGARLPFVGGALTVVAAGGAWAFIGNAVEGLERRRDDLIEPPRLALLLPSDAARDELAIEAGEFGGLGGLGSRRAEDVVVASVGRAREAEPAERLAELATKRCLEELGPAKRTTTAFDRATRYLARGFRMDLEDAHDLAMKALIDVCAAEGRTRFDNPAGAFMTAAKNLAIKRFKRGRYQATYATTVQACAFLELEEVRLDVEVPVIRALIESLPADDQSALYMWARDYDHKEIAAELGITSRRSRDMIGNTLKRLRKAVENACQNAPL